PPPLVGGSTLRKFLQSVATDVDEFWRINFRAAGWTYASPSIQVASSGIGGCGAIHGAAYCRTDGILYLPETFFDPLWPGYDFSIVTIVAHEWGHYVQQRRGIFQLGLPTKLTEVSSQTGAGGVMTWLSGGRERAETRGRR